MFPEVVARFERAFARWLGVDYAFGFWKGRIAMYAILRALGVGEGDEVILPGYTCVMNVNPIKYCGAKPVYVDIEPVTYNMDVSLLDEKITPRTKVIIAQHTYGYPCKMEAITDIATGRGVSLVEDCCLSIGSLYKGKLCGTFGVAAYWSFQWNKPFTTGVGGMATTDNSELAQEIDRLCRNELYPPPAKATAMLAVQRLLFRLFVFPKTTMVAATLFRWLTAKGLVIGSSSKEEFSPAMAGDFFAGMSAGQARAGLRQLRRIGLNITHRRQIAALYDELLGRTGWPVPIIPLHIDPVLVRYPVRVADKDRAIAEAARAMVELGTWFECPLHPKGTPMHLYDYYEGLCPVAEQACRETVNLPTHLRAGHRTAQRSTQFVAEIGPSKWES